MNKNVFRLNNTCPFDSSCQTFLLVTLKIKYTAMISKYLIKPKKITKQYFTLLNQLHSQALLLKCMKKGTMSYLK